MLKTMLSNTQIDERNKLQMQSLWYARMSALYRNLIVWSDKSVGNTLKQQAMLRLLCKLSPLRCLVPCSMPVAGRIFLRSF